MKTVKVRNTVIGEGTPKICVPIVGVTKEEIIDEAKTFDRIPVDVVEWRVDWFEHVFEFDKVLEVLKALREVLGEIPLLMTFRTAKEGGEKAIDNETYVELNQRAARSGYVDLIDVEAFTGDEVVKKIIEDRKTAEKNAGAGCGYSQNRRDASEQKGCSDPSCSYRGNVL